MSRAEVVVVGSGAAGLMAALAASRRRDTLLVTDRNLGRSNTAIAQGGLQLPGLDESSHQRFIADMVASARAPLDMPRVEQFAQEIATTIRELAGLGLGFDRDERGAIIRRAVGGLSEPRIVSVGDRIGTALMKVLLAAVRSSGVEVMAETRILDLESRGGSVELRGRRDDAEVVVSARTAVICTGGISYLEAARRGVRTTNPENRNDVLYGRLRELGLQEVHTDYFQYQPYGIVERSAAGVDACVPESIVTLPVKLRTRSGQVIEPAAMDRLALTEQMFATIEAGDGAVGETGELGLWLNLGDIDPAIVASSFPKLYRLLEREAAIGRDILVCPFLHYQLGGFRVGLDCSTSIPGVYLAGEMVGGIHGRNRLMGNGLTDSLVHGRLAGLAASG